MTLFGHKLAAQTKKGLEGAVKVQNNSQSILWRLKPTLVHFSMHKRTLACYLLLLHVIRVNVHKINHFYFDKHVYLFEILNIVSLIVFLFLTSRGWVC
jgi:hypothetical protein